ncbi:MAG: hypothetical protein NWF05_05125 [Candidatus Bathyarchaeota archaeon]|nr:hypothetical protein [Candidatus Bathyarchaeota archaeon]
MKKPVKNEDRKKQREAGIRGWLPKDVAFPNQPKNRMVQVKPKRKALPTRVYGGAAITTLLAGLFFILIPYYISPQWYTPKANPGWGYTAPATLEGWTMLITGLVLIVSSSVSFILWGLRLNAEGTLYKTSKWFTPRIQTDRGRNAFKIAATTANAVMLSVFLAIHVFTDVTAWSTPSTVAFWGGFAVVLVLVNLLLYEYAKKQTQPNRGTKNEL